MESNEKRSLQLKRNPAQNQFLEVWLGCTAKWEYFRAVYVRHRKARRMAKQLIQNETRLTSDSHHNSAIGNADEPSPEQHPGRRRRLWRMDCHRSVSSRMGVGEAPSHARLTGLMSAGDFLDLFQLGRKVASC